MAELPVGSPMFCPNPDYVAFRWCWWKTLRDVPEKEKKGKRREKGRKGEEKRGKRRRKRRGKVRISVTPITHSFSLSSPLSMLAA